MELSAVLLGLAAVGGITLATIRVRGTPIPPTWIAVGHGIVAAAGLIVLIHAALTRDIPQMAQIALGFIVLAALGGGLLFFGFHMRRRPLPVLIVIVHGMVALSGYALLLLSVFQSAS